MSVSIDPGGCLRHRYSSTYLRISLLHVEFYPPLPYSSLAVTNAVPRLSPGISRASWSTSRHGTGILWRCSGFTYSLCWDLRDRKGEFEEWLTPRWSMMPFTGCPELMKPLCLERIRRK